MQLRGIDFGPILGASGVQGFFGEGYRHHKFLRPFGLDFSGCTFVAKTTTLNPHKGNMPMKRDGITPKEFKPKCIKVYFRKVIMLNAVGLSGPGAEFLFEDGRWQKRTKPFFISFMSIGSTWEERALELVQFVAMFKKYLPGFKSPVGLQINYSCPNVGLEIQALINEAKQGLQAASSLGISLMPKFNILAPVKAVKEIAEDPNCDAVCISNTILWKKLPEQINWKKLFKSDISPLAEFGGGGLSGWPLLFPVADWICEAKQAGIKKPINAGGGILATEDVEILKYAGASSVFIGSIATLRPWRVKKVIKKAHQVFKNEEKHDG